MYQIMPQPIGIERPPAGIRALLRDATRRRWLEFGEPLRVIEAYTPDRVMPALAQLEAELAQGHCIAGFLAYEAAPAFDPALLTHPPVPGQPLLWFGVFRAARPAPGPEPGGPDAYRIGTWTPSITEDQYYRGLAAIHRWLHAGDTYQVNYTFRLRAAFEGDPLALFAALDAAQQGAYSGYIDTGELCIASASPELFFALDGERIVGKPMKGTAARGRWRAEDEANRAALAASAKNRAENLMIVDMIRNDLARIAELGSVRVPALFEVERYPRILQMTSTVEARTRAGLSRLLAALFPCASITGAPKVRTMAIIRELEDSPRGVYTGALGFCLPDGRMQFNVAIRTAVIDRCRNELVFSTGSGIVWDSVNEAEYQECLTKANILDAPPAEFALLETLLWTPEEGHALLDEHLQRLADSAEYFGINCDPADVSRQLAEAVAGADGPRRLRLLLYRDGRCEIRAIPLDAVPERPRVGLARTPVDASDPLLFHKTTRREVYEQARRERPDCDDVILWNSAGELTETSIANLVLELDGRLLTPALDCGLLPGTLRRRLLAEGRIAEARLSRDDLRRATRVWLINSVRGWREAELVN